MTGPGLGGEWVGSSLHPRAEGRSGAAIPGVYGAVLRPTEAAGPWPCQEPSPGSRGDPGPRPGRPGGTRERPGRGRGRGPAWNGGGAGRTPHRRPTPLSAASAPSPSPRKQTTPGAGGETGRERLLSFHWLCELSVCPAPPLAGQPALSIGRRSRHSAAPPTGSGPPGTPPALTPACRVQRKNSR